MCKAAQPPSFLGSEIILIPMKKNDVVVSAVAGTTAGEIAYLATTPREKWNWGDVIINALVAAPLSVGGTYLAKKFIAAIRH